MQWILFTEYTMYKLNGNVKLYKIARNYVEIQFSKAGTCTRHVYRDRDEMGDETA